MTCLRFALAVGAVAASLAFSMGNPAHAMGNDPDPYGQYVGCYVDEPFRALPVFLIRERATLQACVAEAKKQKLRYIGMQYGGQCFGGNLIGYAKVPDAQCDKPCSENARSCGGTWRNSIWKVN